MPHQLRGVDVADPHTVEPTGQPGGLGVEGGARLAPQVDPGCRHHVHDRLVVLHAGTDDPAVPPGGVAAVAVAVEEVCQPHLPVDQLAEDVGVTRVPVGLGEEVDEDPPQRHLRPVGLPVGHPAGGVEVERGDGGVSVRPGAAVQVDDLLARLLGLDPQVRVVLGALLVPRQRDAARPPEGVAEVIERRRPGA